MKPNRKFRKKISIGYNAKEDFFDRVILPFEYYISSVYSAPPASMNIASSRTVPDIAPDEILRLRKKLLKKKIDFNLVFNFDGLNDPQQIKNILFAARYFKPDLLTVNGTYVLDTFLKKTNYKLNISIINDINSLNQLDQLLRRDPKGKRIVSYNIGRRKTYDLDFIKSVKKRFPKLKLKLMVNEGCTFECPDQNFHSCSNTMMRKDNMGFGMFYCQKLTPDEHWRYLAGQFIPPKFLSAYCGLVDEFKIASRGSYGKKMDTNMVVRLLEEYINEEDVSIKRGMFSGYGGSLFAKPFFDANPDEKIPNYLKSYPDDFFRQKSKCRHECYACQYCRNILKG